MHVPSILTAAAAASVLVLGAEGASAQAGKTVNLNPSDNRSYAQREQDRGFADAKKGYDTMQREKQAAEMRDTRHDNRLKTGKDSSVGVDPSSPSINWRTTTK